MTDADMQGLDGIDQRLLIPSERMPLVISSRFHKRDLPGMITQYSVEFEQKLLEHGALLFRGFDVWSMKSFASVVDAISVNRLEYNYRSTPRTDLGANIYTATEYPPSQTIPLHNENAYQKEWPLKLALCCLKPAGSGGETPIADMRKVTAAIGRELTTKFRDRKVRYERYYRSHTDIPWQTVFQTTEPKEVERFCESQQIKCEWLGNDELRTSQVCQGVAFHPSTGDQVFFNQAHLYHVSSLGAEGEKAVLAQYGRGRLPRNAYFGDGGEIPAGDLQAVRDAFQQNAIVFPWEASDVLLLDNMQVAHGRRPFTGKRQVLAALLELSWAKQPSREGQFSR